MSSVIFDYLITYMYHYFYSVHIDHASSFIVKMYTFFKNKSFEFGSYQNLEEKKRNEKIIKRNFFKKYSYRRNRNGVIRGSVYPYSKLKVDFAEQRLMQWPYLSPSFLFFYTFLYKERGNNLGLCQPLLIIGRVRSYALLPHQIADCGAQTQTFVWLHKNKYMYLPSFYFHIIQPTAWRPVISNHLPACGNKIKPFKAK